MRNFLLITLVLVVSVSEDALAEGTRPWVAASGSWNSYAMDAVNDNIGSLNELIAPESMDEISSGIGFGAAAGVDLARFTLSLGYEWLPATSEVQSQLGDFDYDLAADVFVGRVAWRIPVSSGFILAAGVGGGIATVSGSAGATDAPTLIRKGSHPTVLATIIGPRAAISGNGPCFEGFIQADAALGGRVSIVPAIGYRSAKIDGTQKGSEGEADGTFDFSGVLARVGLKYAFD